MGNVDGFQNGNLGGVFPISVSDLLNKWREWKCPLVWRNGDEEGRKPILVYSIYEEQMLMLPERFGKRFVLQTSIGGAPRSLRRVNSTSDSFNHLSY